MALTGLSGSKHSKNRYNDKGMNKKSTSFVSSNMWDKRTAYFKLDVINVYKQSERIKMFVVFLLV